MTRRRRAAIALAVGGTWLGAASLAAGQTVSPQGTQPGGLASGTPPADVASKCSSCHAGGLDDDGKTFRPWDTWSGTMMANATRDPLYLAALTVSEQDAPGSGAYCLRCHTPKGFVKGHATGVGAALDADDNQGVDCEACHRAIDASVAQPEVLHDGATIAALAALDAQAPYIGNARLVWDPRDVRHGPHDDADSPAHAAAGSPFSGSSALCGQCHEVLSPLRNLRDASGADTGFPFPLDNTYTEWASSDYARAGTTKSCVDCHMPRARGDALTVSTFPSAMSRTNPRMHLFVGGNAWGLEAIKLAAPDVAAGRAAAFEATATAVQAMLASAVRIELTPGAATAGATSYGVTVRVTNLTGHKFPTGYADGRRAFLQVELQDAQGASIALRGRYDAAGARLDPDSVIRVWESIQAEHLPGGGHHEWHIAKNDTVVLDTRIPPAGFRPVGAAAIAMTAPVGADYGPVTGMRNHDDVAVTFSSLSPLSGPELRVVARVFYQSTVRELIEELARANTTDDRGARLMAIWEQTGRAAPTLIASASATVAVGAAAPASDAGCACDASPGRPDGITMFCLTLLGALGLTRKGGVMANVKPVPEGYSTVVAYMSVKGASDALAYYKKAFGAEELVRMPMPDGKVGHAEIKIGDSIVMLADEMDHPDAIAKSPRTLGGVTSGLCIYVADCDAMFNGAVAAGGKVRRPLTNQFYGDRSGTVEDPFGQVWTISTHVEDVPPDEMDRRMKEFAKT